MKNNKTKKIIAVTAMTLGTLSFANAQTLNITESQKGIFEQAKAFFQSGKTAEAENLLKQNGLKTFGERKEMRKEMKDKMHGRKMDRKDNRNNIHAAIVAGNYADFQKVASTSPLAKIDQTTFNSLVPHFTALKNAKTQIESILKAAGIEKPSHK